MVDAVNKAMKDILDNHSENRVGITLFSGGAWDFLEMDHYTSSNGVFLEVEQKTFRETSGSSTVPAVVLSDTIRTSAGSKPAEPTTVQGFGTYTQAGIAKGAEMLEGVSDTTYSATYGSGENERTYTVQRQPVIILMSDGEPTYATNNYKDVLSGPHYGNGQSTSGNGQNNQGILGYYTVMSANHYKRMVGIHYEKPALFYTVGMGIYETGTGDMSGNTQDGDNYKRAVLNPTAEAIAELEDGGFNKAYTNDMLRDLLQNNYNQPYVTVGTGWTNDFTGVPHQRLPVLSNPYSNYSYADGAYFGEISDENLNKIFGDILTNSLKINRYGFVLRGNSAAELIDPIGEGMEVKGDPILRYGGRNYAHTSTSVSGNTITYTYSYHYKSTDGSMQEADLSDIRVQITTDANGLQTVTMAIPDNVIPAYVPHFSTEQDAIDFYYESLPVRLIYQVGLTEEAQADVAALKGPGGTLTYYTNRWDADLRGDHAISIFKPTDENPFYAENGPYQEHHTTKSENLTGTDPQAVKCHRDFTVYEGVTVPEIIHDLGNNGKLVFTAEKTLFDIPVQKLWDLSVGENAKQPIEVHLYRVGEQAELIDTLTLSSENNWQGIFAELPQLESGWYAIAEDAPEGFWASYNTETHPILVGEKMVTMVRIDGKSAGEVPTVVITNKTSYMLPETGGMGRELFTMSGGLLMLGALGCGYGLRRKRERGRMR